MSEINVAFVNDVYTDNYAAALDAIKGVLAAKALARVERARPEVAATLFDKPEEEQTDGEDA